MSHIGPSVTPSSSNESSPVSSLTLLILLLIPCVVLLLLLNCMFLGYKILILSKKKRKRRRGGSETTILQSTLSTRHVTRISETPSQANQSGKDYLSIPVPVLAQPAGSSSLTSSKERAALGQRCRASRPDGATGGGSESLRAPSTILATMSTTNSTTRADLPRRSQLYSRSSSGGRRLQPAMTHYSDSETDRGNTAPPNSPVLNGPPLESPANVGPMRRSSTMELIDTVGTGFEYEYASSMPPDNLCLVASANSSTVGPGLDSDFGASAGISLRILSCDSDGLSNALLSSPMEWDYYDPCYVSQNNIAKHMFHMPTVITKQYWV
ncbi:protein huluwa [Brienomyrus brachyistius]|uniref:protein huluwa n=1 Tax=Brienomyrus brachyistius TaxID=42636 RepID=UPI0020B20F00|nr:protein huluwa [Brienomyrus brachyistius]